MKCSLWAAAMAAAVALSGFVLVSGTKVEAQQSPLTDALLQPGPYGVGVSSLTLVDPTRTTPEHPPNLELPVRTLPTEIWYPAADPTADEVVDAPVAVGPTKFPFVVHGHGFGSSRGQVRFLAKHLASHGYVVASLDYPLSNGATPGGPTTIDLPGQVGDMIFVSQAVLFHPGFAPAAQIDPDLLAFSGHSFGGLTTALAAEFVGDVAYMMSPPACGLFLPGGPGSSLGVPSFTIGGDTDAVTPFDLNFVPLYEAVGDPKYLVQIVNGSHLGFVNSAPLLEQIFPGPIDNYLCTQFPEVDDPNAEVCGLCTELVAAPQLAASRQLDLTKATALAFFDGYLRGQPMAKAYLKYILESENPELIVSYSGTPAQNP